MAMVFTTTAGRSGLSLCQERSVSATALSSQDRAGRSPYPGLLPLLSLVASIGTMDARQGLRHLRTPIGRRDRHDQVNGCRAASADPTRCDPTSPAYRGSARSDGGRVAPTLGAIPSSA